MKPSSSTQQTAPTRITLPRTPAVLEAERAGVDLKLLEDNLNLTSDERFARHASALALVLELDRLREAKIEFQSKCKR